MGSTLIQRAQVVEDQSLSLRVSQALKELGKKAVVADCVAAIVLASTAVGDKATQVGKLLGESITDAEIIAYVKALA
jgi:hypothetical protein